MRHLLFVPIVLCCGCSASWWAGKDSPYTRLKLNPVTRTVDLYNSKDVDSEISDLTFVAAYGGRPPEMHLGRWKLSDTASTVREANATQINALAQVQAMQIDYLRAAGDSFNNALSALLTAVLQYRAPEPQPGDEEYAPAGARVDPADHSRGACGGNPRATGDKQ